MSIENFPYLTLSQVKETQGLLEGLQEVPVINGITVEGMEALLPVLVAMIEEARELEDIAERAGFPMNEAAHEVYGSTARIFIQGPGAAQVRLDVSKKIEIVEVEDAEPGVDDLDFFEPDEGWELEADVVDLFGPGGPRPEGTD